jgi:hypothetical protein
LILLLLPLDHPWLTRGKQELGSIGAFYWILVAGFLSLAFVCAHVFFVHGSPIAIFAGAVIPLGHVQPLFFRAELGLSLASTSTLTAGLEIRAK